MKFQNFVYYPGMELQVPKKEKGFIKKWREAFKYSDSQTEFRKRDEEQVPPAFLLLCSYWNHFWNHFKEIEDAKDSKLALSGLMPAFKYSPSKKS